MEDILKIIKTAMDTLNVTYYYLYNNAPTISYPYATGEFNANDYSYEDNSNGGDFIINIWNRGSNVTLVQLADTIKNYFRNYQAKSGTTYARVSFDSAFAVYTNEADLFRIEIHLSIKYWEGI